MANLCDYLKEAKTIQGKSEKQRHVKQEKNMVSDTTGNENIVWVVLHKTTVEMSFRYGMFNPNIYTTVIIKTSLSTKSKTVFLPGSRQVYAQVWEWTCFPFTGRVKELQFLGFLFWSHWYSESYTTSYRPQCVESWMVSMAELHPATGTPVHNHWTLEQWRCVLWSEELSVSIWQSDESGFGCQSTCLSVLC